MQYRLSVWRNGCKRQWRAAGRRRRHERMSSQRRILEDARWLFLIKFTAATSVTSLTLRRVTWNATYPEIIWKSVTLVTSVISHTLQSNLWSFMLTPFTKELTTAAISVLRFTCVQTRWKSTNCSLIVNQMKCPKASDPSNSWSQVQVKRLCYSHSFVFCNLFLETEK